MHADFPVRHDELAKTAFARLLMVCVGNVCRSPTAEFLFRHHLVDCGVQVESAGLAALVGNPMDAMAKQLLLEHGLDGEAHRARQLTMPMLRAADLICVMEKTHLYAVNQWAPEVSGKVFLLARWLHGRDVPDPHRQGRPVFEHVYAVIEDAVHSWLPYLK